MDVKAMALEQYRDENGLAHFLPPFFHANSQCGKYLYLFPCSRRSFSGYTIYKYYKTEGIS